LITKRDEYAETGVCEYYILDCEGRDTTFYRSVGDPKSVKRVFELLPIGADGVVRSETMPGFQFRLRDLYHQPSLKELVADEVYRGYVWLAYQAQQRRAEQAEAEAAVERQRAEQEHQRAEQADQRAESERLRAEQADQRAEKVRLQAAEATALAQKYAAQLRTLGLLPAEESAS
jgi:hypothetical protein